MYRHNYKGLPYKESCKQFIKDYRLKYFLYGKNILYKTKNNEKIKVKNLNKKHINNIVNCLGCTNTRNYYPFIYYRYLKEIIKESE